MISSDDQLQALGEQFCSRTLSKADWTHEAHIAAAVYLLAMRPELQPERDMPSMIRALNDAHGVRNSDREGYHHTITLASLGAVRAFLGENCRVLPSTAVNAIMQTRYGASGWLLDHWTKLCLFSPAARRGWIAPNLSPLPFPVIVENEEVTD